MIDWSDSNTKFKCRQSITLCRLLAWVPVVSSSEWSSGVIILPLCFPKVLFFQGLAGLQQEFLLPVMAPSLQILDLFKADTFAVTILRKLLLIQDCSLNDYRQLTLNYSRFLGRMDCRYCFFLTLTLMLEWAKNHWRQNVLARSGCA